MTAQELEKLLTEVTPGEWVLEVLTSSDPNGDDWETDVEIASSSGIHIHGHDLGYSDETDERIKANARLIALAPTLARRVIAAEKLAEALKRELDGDLGQMPHTSTRLDAAIAEWDAAK